MIRLTAATTGSRLDTLSLTNLYSRLVVYGRGAHTLLDLSSHRQKGLLDIRRVLGRCFQKWDSKAISKFLNDAYVS